MSNQSNNQLIHQIHAGALPSDTSTELFACRDSRRVFGVSQGKTVPFNEICATKRAQIFKKLLGDSVAMEDLKHLPETERIEQFAFCIYGGLDHQADFCENGVLKESDNFLCSGNCICRNWPSKKITLNNKRLTAKKIEVLTLLCSDLADKQIADQLQISQSTLDTHKTQLFEIAGVFSKGGLIMAATRDKIIQ
ncbi:helix-turn-helix transcriptional regulator [Flavobacterium sp. 3HN19-14]|uniref:helix-turn-helix transcriptional regulator n=1 Tax=Flavobacterium sp. 3HN19-14 TaxID=3448133 RepID=UPI003EE37A04